MNLIEEGFQEKEEKKKKMTTTIILSGIIILVIAIVSIIAYIMYVKSNTLKVYLDGKINDKLKELLMIEEDGTVYVPIKEIASYFGYESYNGEYTEKSENASKCYIQNENEVVNFTLNSKKIYILDLTKSSENYEYVYTKNPVKASDGVLYASTDMIEKAFNISFQYEQDKNKITILTMPYLIQAYSSKVLDFGYTSISDVFANQKTVLQDMLVVEKNEKYGVISVDGKAILEAKYDNITYLPNLIDGKTQNFLVENNKKVGIMTGTGETKVQIMYDSIELMDSDAGLYVAKKDNKYGVLDLKGNVKIYIENDEIGMDISKFEENNIKSKYILVGNLIPVRKNNYWGLYDKNGNQVVDFKYDSFGYIASSNKDALNLLVIPEYNVLVACKNKKYTLLSSSGEELFAAPVADDIYMTISGGEKHYYITANNGKMDAKEYLDRIGISTDTETTNITSNVSSSTNTSSNSNNSQLTGNTINRNQEQQNNKEEQDNNQQENNEEEQYNQQQENNEEEQYNEQQENNGEE